ncbi:hypothetical protein [Streptomyces sp. NPDC007264]|uniref:hypothetical protein n=1 Tax=Streptomyces sp. NPDC007264 TaxID=3364777 RepID=UPI0036D95FD5
MVLVRGKKHRVLKSVAVAAALAAAGGAAVPTAAQALPGHTATRVAAKPAAASSNYSYLWFRKNSRNPANSRLEFVFVQDNGDRHHVFTVASWRAGSGSGSTNSCLKNRGWLPNGTYKMLDFTKHHNGGAHGVNGIAWHISDHKCSNGTWRTDLFIHSEMLPSGRQGSSEPYRWDGASDYRSNGCIKLKPADIRRLSDLRSSYPMPKKLYVS